ncbi:MAG: hypothetical protein H7301_05600 [Cryobacterium sp.]|nr:hypothetical protein [Oligoflexia bacterium]
MKLTVILGIFLLVSLPTLAKAAAFPVLSGLVGKFARTGTDADFSRAIAQLKFEAKRVDSKLQATTYQIQMSGPLVINAVDAVSTSEEKASSLKAVDDEANEVIQIAESFTKPLNRTQLAKMTEILENQNADALEIYSMEIRESAFNDELKRSSALRAKLYFYY